MAFLTNFLAGKKTLFAALGFISKGLIGLAMHVADPASPLAMEPGAALQDILTGAGFIGLRFAK